MPIGMDATMTSSAAVAAAVNAAPEVPMPAPLAEAALEEPAAAEPEIPLPVDGVD